MGRGIAQAAATSGLEVHRADRDLGDARAGRAAIEEVLAGLAERGKLPRPEAEAALERIVAVAPGEGIDDREVIIEAVPEVADLKERILAEVDRQAGPEAVLASNTSSIGIGRLGRATRRPDRVLGLHFMVPVPVMPVVELVRGVETGEPAVERARALAAAMGKEVIDAGDVPGFILNRLLIPFINEAIFAVEDGAGSISQVDRTMKTVLRHPIGPLALADVIGLDVVLLILEVLQRDFGDPKYRPALTLRRKVEAGHLGRKTGRGFYDYPPGPAPVVNG
jgi:3-hydroxybutyryl-CoA dehydrogenase